VHFCSVLFIRYLMRFFPLGSSQARSVQTRDEVFNIRELLPGRVRSPFVGPSVPLNKLLFIFEAYKGYFVTGTLLGLRLTKDAREPSLERASRPCHLPSYVVTH